MNVRIVRFHKESAKQWNDFIDTAKNAVFLLHRSYLEYHEDRFTDHSLFIFNKDKLVALFPANEIDDVIHSHAGVTFAGLILSGDVKAKETLEIFEKISAYYRGLNFKELYYKAIPSIYHRYTSEEDLYALFRNNATLYRRDISSVIQLSNPIRFSETKRQAITKCENAGIVVLENNDFTEYWELLSSVLAKFSTTPVHTIDEITYLKAMFPQNIRLFEARFGGELLAGIVMYVYNHVVHTQYMANSARGRTIGALDFINSKLITDTFKEKMYYSFGISTEAAGLVLNEGLIQQKEMMGGRAIVNDFYKITL
jgi:hypothetical protein